MFVGCVTDGFGIVSNLAKDVLVQEGTFSGFIFGSDPSDIFAFVHSGGARRFGSRDKTSPTQGSRALIILQICRGLFSGISKPNFFKIVSIVPHVWRYTIFAHFLHRSKLNMCSLGFYF